MVFRGDYIRPRAVKACFTTLAPSGLKLLSISSAPIYLKPSFSGNGDSPGRKWFCTNDLQIISFVSAGVVVFYRKNTRYFFIFVPFFPFL